VSHVNFFVGGGKVYSQTLWDHGRIPPRYATELSGSYMGIQVGTMHGHLIWVSCRL